MTKNSGVYKIFIQIKYKKYWKGRTCLKFKKKWLILFGIILRKKIKNRLRKLWKWKGKCIKFNNRSIIRIIIPINNKTSTIRMILDSMTKDIIVISNSLSIINTNMIMIINCIIKTNTDTPTLFNINPLSKNPPESKNNKAQSVIPLNNNSNNKLGNNKRM